VLHLSRRDGRAATHRAVQTAFARAVSRRAPSRPWSLVGRAAMADTSSQAMTHTNTAAPSTRHAFVLLPRADHAVARVCCLVHLSSRLMKLMPAAGKCLRGTRSSRRARRPSCTTGRPSSTTLSRYVARTAPPDQCAHSCSLRGQLIQLMALRAHSWLQRLIPARVDAQQRHRRDLQATMRWCVAPSRRAMRAGGQPGHVSRGAAVLRGAAEAGAGGGDL